MDRLLTEEKIEQLNEERKEALSTIEEKSKYIVEKEKEFRENEEKIKSLQSEIKDCERILYGNQRERMLASQISKENSYRVSEIETILAADTRNRAIKDFYEKQIGFYTALEKKIQEAQEETEEEAIGFFTMIPSDKSVENIRLKIEGKYFDDDSISLRGIKNTYEKLILQLSTKKIDKESINPIEVREPQEYLKRIVGLNPVIRYWQHT